jgi:hypothetical protein
MMMMQFLNDTTRPWLSVTRPSSRICRQQEQQQQQQQQQQWWWREHNTTGSVTGKAASHERTCDENQNPA